MTSNANAELFSITASTPTDGRRHGAAAAYGRASASAALDRGLTSRPGSRSAPTSTPRSVTRSAALLPAE